MAFPAIVGSPATYADNTGLVTNHPVTLPSSLVAGNKVIIGFVGNGSVTVTTPTNWDLLGSPNATPGSYDSVRYYQRDVDGTWSSDTTVTITLSGAARACAIAVQISGARTGATSSEIAISAITENGTAVKTADPPSLNPGWGAEDILWLAFGTGHDGNSTFTSYATSYGLAQANVLNGAGSGNAIALCARQLNASSEDPGVITWSNTKARTGTTIAVRATAAKTLTADAGSYALTGQTASLEYGRETEAGSGSYAFTGSTASLEYGREVAGDSGSYAFTGTSADLVISAEKVILADSGVYAWSGQAASLEVGRILTADGSSYSWSGQAASLEYGFEVEGQGGAYLFTGQVASLELSRVLVALPGSYAFTGTAASLERGLEVITISGSYLFTGSTATLFASRPAPIVATLAVDGVPDLKIETPLPVFRVEENAAHYPFRVQTETPRLKVRHITETLRA